jgi:nucleoside-diphosphate-sugar epimerase
VKALVTGATGFIGSHLTETLVGRGRDVRCLVRDTSRCERLIELGVELTYADLLDRETLPGCLRGVGSVYHLAGAVFSPRASDYARINIEGTQNLTRTCLDKGIEKFIYFSSIAAVGPNREKDRKLVETDAMHPVTPYGRSKYQAEKLLSNLAQEEGLPVVIVRPPIVFGPRAVGCRSAVLFRNFLSGRTFLIGGGRNVLSLIYVKNLIEAAVLIGDSSITPGDVFFACDSSFSVRELGRIVAGEAGIHLREVNIPVPLAALMIRLPRLFEKLDRSSSALRQDGIIGITSDWDCSSLKLEKELGFSPPFDTRRSIRETIEWYEGEKVKDS